MREPGGIHSDHLRTMTQEAALSAHRLAEWVPWGVSRSRHSRHVDGVEVSCVEKYRAGPFSVRRDEVRQTGPWVVHLSRTQRTELVATPASGDDDETGEGFVPTRTTELSLQVLGALTDADAEGPIDPFASYDICDRVEEVRFCDLVEAPLGGENLASEIILPAELDRVGLESVYGAQLRGLRWLTACLPPSVLQPPAGA